MAREFTIRNVNGGSRRIVVPGEDPAPAVEVAAEVVEFTEAFTPAVEQVEEVGPDGVDLG